MYESYLGTIVAWAGFWVPKGWALCNGQQLPIAQYQALYAVIGTQYGGDGVNTFAMPSLVDTHEKPIKYIICVEGLFPPRD
ncbi:MAG: phage tail protein [Candidatus Fimivivens sp.]|nr:phage tail protein [Candidatus Fimivivens sp.]